MTREIQWNDGFEALDSEPAERRGQRVPKICYVAAYARITDMANKPRVDAGTRRGGGRGGS